MKKLMSMREPFERDGYWYCEIDRRRRSLKTKSKAEARRRFNALKKLYLEGKLKQLTGECSTTLEEFTSEILVWVAARKSAETTKGWRTSLGHLTQVAGNTIRLDRVTPKHWDAIVTELKGYSPRSLNAFLGRLKSMFQQAVIWGYLKANPFRGVKMQRATSRPPSFIPPNKIPAFLASIKDLDVRRFCTALIYTGRRQGELLSLTWDKVAEGRYTAFLSKQKKWVTFPAHPMLKALLSSLPREGARVFPRWARSTSSSVAVKKALVEGGYGHLHAHDLRHTFASMVVLAGNDLKTTQHLLGHENIASTEIYAHLTQEALVAALDRVAGAPVDLCGQSADRAPGIRLQ